MTDGKMTVDGVPVKVGDRVWRVHACGVRLCTLHKHHLGAWWDSMVKEQIYSTERAALAGAIEAEKEALKRTNRNARRALKAIERWTARLREAERRREVVG